MQLHLAEYTFIQWLLEIKKIPISTWITLSDNELSELVKENIKWSMEAPYK